MGGDVPGSDCEDLVIKGPWIQCLKSPKYPKGPSKQISGFEVPKIIWIIELAT